MPARRGRDGRWRYRKMVHLPDGSTMRVSGTPDVNTKLAAEAAERAHIERVLKDAANPGAKRKEELPTFEAFVDEFKKTYVAANNKPSERLAKEAWFRNHLLPAFGKKRLDEITAQDIEKLKAKALGAKKSPKTVNNILTCLSKTLRYAADCGLLESVPRFKSLRICQPKIDFLDFDEAAKLIAAAAADAEELALILCGIDAGLRVGEIRALQWDDLDLGRRQMTVQRTDYRGHLGSPKGGRLRTIPMTKRLVDALKSIRHLKGPFVFCTVDEPTDKDKRPKARLYTQTEADTFLARARRAAKLRAIGWHTLRHSFCSHLAMKGAPVRTIQELAGHASIATTQRYMHLTPHAAESAVALLETPWQAGGKAATGSTEAGEATTEI